MNVEFEDRHDLLRPYQNKGRLAHWLVERGVFKSENVSNVFLLILVLLCITAAVMLPAWYFSDKEYGEEAALSIDEQILLERINGL